MPKDDAPDRMKHGWFPMGTGKNYKATDMHKSIMPLRDKITFISGLSHPDTRNTSAHKGADWFLKLLLRSLNSKMAERGKKRR